MQLGKVLSTASTGSFLPIFERQRSQFEQVALDQLAPSTGKPARRWKVRSAPGAVIHAVRRIQVVPRHQVLKMIPAPSEHVRGRQGPDRNNVNFRSPPQEGLRRLRALLCAFGRAAGRERASGLPDRLDGVSAPFTNGRCRRARRSGVRPTRHIRPNAGLPSSSTTMVKSVSVRGIGTVSFTFSRRTTHTLATGEFNLFLVRRHTSAKQIKPARACSRDLKGAVGFTEHFSRHYSMWCMSTYAYWGRRTHHTNTLYGPARDSYSSILAAVRDEFGLTGSPPRDTLGRKTPAPRRRRRCRKSRRLRSAVAAAHAPSSPAARPTRDRRSRTACRR